jgi:hypothetical protein
MPTHTSENTLDLFIIRSSDPITLDKPVADYYISDHSFVTAMLTLEKPSLLRKKVLIRKTKDIDQTLFGQDLEEIVQNSLDIPDGEELVMFYNCSLKSLFDKHAPEHPKVITVREKVPWYTADLRSLKQERRQCERKWLSTKSDEALRIYKDVRSRYRRCLESSKTVHITEKVNTCGSDSRKLFSLVKNLVNKSTNNPLLDMPEEEQPDQFVDYFYQKIALIRNDLDCLPTYQPVRSIPENVVFPCFSEMTSDEVQKIIKDSKPTTCLSDPIPSTLVKDNISLLLPLITRIVNNSLNLGMFSLHWKTAYVSPLLKKEGLPNICKNYRPVSNVAFLSKIVEKCALKQFRAHMDKYELLPSYQSAYRTHYSTETALLKLHNDILLQLDKKQGVALVMVDLSAAFDTVDHDILLEVLRNKFGVQDVAHKWFSSYLRPRHFTVSVKGHLSKKMQLDFSVPQGSCAGPVLYTTYASTLPEAFSNDSIHISGYADDHAFYRNFTAGDRLSELQCITELEQALDGVIRWMGSNRLKINTSKTEILLITSTYFQKSLTTSHVRVGEDNIAMNTKTKLLGSWLDNKMAMTSEVNNKCKVCSFHLNNLRKIRPYLSEKVCHQLVQAMVISILDYGNSLLVGLPKVLTDKLQSIQNSAAKLILQKNRDYSASSCLKTLHWLPIEYRIKFKVLCYLYKCLNGAAPQYLTSMFSLRTSRYSTRSANSSNLEVPRTKTKTFGDRAFSVVGAKLWNDLPLPIRQADSFECFKKQLKTHFYQKAYFN